MTVYIRTWIRRSPFVTKITLELANHSQKEMFSFLRLALLLSAASVAAALSNEDMIESLREWELDHLFETSFRKHGFTGHTLMSTWWGVEYQIWPTTQKLSSCTSTDRRDKGRYRRNFRRGRRPASSRLVQPPSKSGGRPPSASGKKALYKRKALHGQKSFYRKTARPRFERLQRSAGKT